MFFDTSINILSVACLTSIMNFLSIAFDAYPCSRVSSTSLPSHIYIYSTISSNICFLQLLIFFTTLRRSYRLPYNNNNYKFDIALLSTESEIVI